MTPVCTDKFMPQTEQKTFYSTLFLIVAALFITTLVTANIIAVKIVAVGKINLPAGTIIFPLSYLFGDVLTEVYGYKKTRVVIWLGFFCNLLAVAAIALAQRMPAAIFWPHQEAFVQILGFSPRLLMASFIAYLAGEFLNAMVLARLKILTKGRFLWTRTIGSTVVGQAVDSLIFVSLAFSSNLQIETILTMALTQWLIKSAYEVAATPFTYLVVNFLKKREGLDTFDYGTKYNPFSW